MAATRGSASSRAGRSSRRRIWTRRGAGLQMARLHLPISTAACSGARWARSCAAAAGGRSSSEAGAQRWLNCSTAHAGKTITAASAKEAGVHAVSCAKGLVALVPQSRHANPKELPDEVVLGRVQVKGHRTQIRIQLGRQIHRACSKARPVARKSRTADLAPGLGHARSQERAKHLALACSDALGVSAKCFIDVAVNVDGTENQLLGGHAFSRGRTWDGSGRRLPRLPAVYARPPPSSSSAGP